MEIPHPPKQQNRYFIMRHGESESNVAGINVTDPALGIGKYGLTERGRTQAKESAKALSDYEPAVIFTSPFRRARETAEIVRTCLDEGIPIEVREELRERGAGGFEGKSAASFLEIYGYDEQSAQRVPFGVEPTGAIVDRLAVLFADVERTFSGETVLLVSHGDILSVLQAWIIDSDLHQHHRHMIPTGAFGELGQAVQ